MLAGLAVLRARYVGAPRQHFSHRPNGAPPYVQPGQEFLQNTGDMALSIDPVNRGLTRFHGEKNGPDIGLGCVTTATPVSDLAPAG